MLHSLLSLKLAAMAAALGLNTSDWNNPSPEMVTQVEKLEKAVGGIAEPTKSDQSQTEINEAISAIRALAEKGDKDAQYAMGLFAQQSNQQGAIDQAAKFYEQAANQGQFQAMNNYGFILALSGRDNEKTEEGISWIKKAADAGNNPARRNMAQIYLRGLGGQKADSAGALKLLETAAADKDDQAAFEISQYYMGAAGADKVDDNKGWEWLTKAADMGNPNALDTLGSLLLDGGKIGSKEIAADPKAAISKFQSLADKKNAVGLRKMGGVYESGLAGQTKDFQKALQLYTEAAQGNDAIAQFKLATMFDNGVDLDPKDDKVDLQPNAATAMNLYRAAAQNNLAIAHFYVGSFYEAGRTVDRDPVKAFTSFQLAAQSGIAQAMQKVGLYYLNGAGTLKDPVAASSWFARAALAGLPEGHLYYGIVTENGLGGTSEKETPFYAAADSYMQALDAPNAPDQVRMEALLRLGNLYYRGVMVAKGDPPKPDFERAYIFFRQAVDIDPKNAVAESARSEVHGKLTQEQIKRADTSIEQMKKDREARKAKAAAEASAPAAAPAPAAPAKK